MSLPHWVKFCDGPLDGVTFEVPAAIEKIVVQLANNNVLRYEHDLIEEYDDRTEGRLVLTGDPDEFDAEMKHDAAKGIE